MRCPKKASGVGAAACPQAAAASGARHFGAQPLFLKDCARAVFFPFLDAEFPSLAQAYRQYYATRSYPTEPYADKIHAIVAGLKQKYGLTGKQMPLAPEWGQMGLFVNEEEGTEKETVVGAVGLEPTTSCV